MLNVKNILVGWKNVIFENVAVEEKAHDRAQICATCPHSSKSKYMDFLIKEKQWREMEGAMCDKCGCPLISKLRSPDEKCPVGLWQ